MNELKATPGDWEEWTSNSHWRLTGPDGVDGGVLSASIASDGHPIIVCKPADRALIKASRDLYEALADIEPFLNVWMSRFPKNAGYSLNTGEPDEGHFFPEHARKMLAALKKARGE